MYRLCGVRVCVCLLTWSFILNNPRSFASKILFEWNGRLRSGHYNTAAVAWRNRPEALGINVRQRTSLERCQPQTQQVSLAIGFGVILERGAVVQDCVVVY